MGLSTGIPRFKDQTPEESTAHAPFAIILGIPGYSLRETMVSILQLEKLQTYVQDVLFIGPLKS